ncbi:MAG: hypothetical protein CVV48_07365 [Spirochaetae bacterium HGW-Spirochaetae-4]|nr:MAG: hypothetical protein CVV48_07365 [Spirochaetae bacterium HGW-Spirochaetae-4]
MLALGHRYLSFQPSSSYYRYDPLTHLVSRYQYRSEMQMLINQHPDAQDVFCYVDIANFKGKNDMYGHAIGDLYMVEFAMFTAKRSGNHVYRRFDRVTYQKEKDQR